MVDTAKEKAMPDVKFWLKNSLQHNDLANVPVLIYLNKTDLPGALSTEKVIELCDLDFKSHEVHI